MVQKVRLLILVSLGWPGMPRFWDQVPISIEILLQLPAFPTQLKQLRNEVFHKNPQYLNLHDLCLGVSNSKNKASLGKWQRKLLPLHHNLHLGSVIAAQQVRPSPQYDHPQGGTGGRDSDSVTKSSRA